MNVALWVVQALLAALFLFSGGMKLVLPLDALKGPVELPGLFMRFIGVCEVLGGVGLVAPQLTGIRPGLTPLAAAALVIVMIGATVVTIVGGAGAVTLVPIVTGLLCAFVAWGRLRSLPAGTPSRRTQVDVAR